MNVKKKKKIKLTKKEKLLLICIAIIALLLIIGIATTPTKIPKSNTSTNIADDLNKELTSIEEVIKYLESTYISMEDSKIEGYDTDIYLNFRYNLYDGELSKELYFKNFYEQIARVSNFKSFRLIDESKKINIAIKCATNKITEVLINGEKDYYKKEASRRSKENELKIENSKLEINSKELKDLINAGWETENVNLGTQESTYNKYQIYFDEGYEIRTVKGKVFNIVFTEKYNKEIVDGIKTGDNLEKIQALLGTSYIDTGIIGYKTRDFYIMFTDKQISIYPNYQYDYTEFENLVKEYNEKKDINDFMDKLTDIWPDYDSYTYDTKYMEIFYTLKGVRIKFTSTSKDGIQIYENYKGSLKNEKEDYTDVYYKLNENLVIQKETLRKMGDMFDNSGIENDPIHYSNMFFLSYMGDNEGKSKIKIISMDENYPNNEFDETVKISSYVWANDSYLIYGIYNDGIYGYDAKTRKTEKLISGKDEYNITNYDRKTNIIEYDNQRAYIEF